MAEKRKRGQNFSGEEKERLIKILMDHRDTILNKKTDGATNEAKYNAWMAVTESFNMNGNIYRSKDSLMKIWEKLKTESKIYYTASRRDTTQTGGGPSVIKIDPILEQVCSIVGRGCTGIQGVPDSDAMETTEQSFPKVPQSLEDTENVSTNTINIELFEESNIINELPKKEQDISNTPLPKKPLWSRRRPLMSQPNERSEGVASVCNSFKDINKLKETTENLNIQLKLEEIEFKRKLHDLQLQAAIKDLEIKNEILLQIRGGALPLQNLLGVQQNNNDK